ncbi:cell wall metabolism sensor histidine kinase WalK [Gluconobacter cerinus]|uniref:histidine kinase n=1 Tax=Gluconobacter cerinus TaxID=38307 RepID=A0A1B6VGL1_9PROT|nr:ATP-binding protein [Gluconobacter cerinus]OAJ66330.1 two-component system sensor histidine kinase [Gluconobacter cerinus]
MILFRWFEDTITRRLVTTVALAAGTTLGLLQLFSMFGGHWAQPNIEQTGLLQEVAAVSRVISAAPSEVRPRIAHAATTPSVRFVWFDVKSLTAHALQTAHYKPYEVQSGRELIASLIGNPKDKIDSFSVDNPVAQAPGLAIDPKKYPDATFMALQLDDGSWLVCIALVRSWGFFWRERLFLELATIVAWIIAVSIIASRQLSRPIENLAKDVRRAGMNTSSAPIPATGPRELQLVAHTINAMREQIQSFIAARTTMLAAISHDLRTPLTRLRLRGEFIDDPEQQARLFRDVDEMQAMVDGALSFFRDDAVCEEVTTFDLPGILRTVVNDFTDQNINLEYSGPTRATYQGRPFALKRIFTNLVENAVKYATPPSLELTCTPTHFVVTVRDHGPGIPDDQIGRIFEPYFRGDKSRNRETGGIGLGLTSALSIVQTHGGEIQIVNHNEGGLEVRVILPKLHSMS